MKYHFVFSEKAKKQLFKLDNYTQQILISWIEKNIEGCENPKIIGKSLKGNYQGLWRYRVGDYRIIVKIENDLFIVLGLEIGHRKKHI